VKKFVLPSGLVTDICNKVVIRSSFKKRVQAAHYSIWSGSNIYDQSQTTAFLSPNFERSVWNFRIISEWLHILTYASWSMKFSIQVLFRRFGSSPSYTRILLSSEYFHFKYFFNKKVSSISGCTSTGDFPDANTFTKRKQLGMTLTKMHWLLWQKSRLSTSNKILIYKAILKPIWTYGIQLWGAASTSNIEILERVESKVLRVIVDAPGYVPNAVIRRDLQTSTVKEEVEHYCSLYSALLGVHPNDLVVNVMA
jgi:hypothetical protein